MGWLSNAGPFLKFAYHDYFKKIFKEKKIKTKLLNFALMKICI